MNYVLLLSLAILNKSEILQYLFRIVAEKI